MKLWTVIDGWIYGLEKALIVLIAVGMTWIIFADFIGRYVFSQSISWSAQSASYMMFWLALIGASMATKNEKHLNVNVLSKILPAHWAYPITALAYFFSAAFCALLTYLSAVFVLETFHFGDIMTTLKMPLWILQVVLPFAFVIMTVRFGACGVKYSKCDILPPLNG